jgi:hypothetical protein
MLTIIKRGEQLMPKQRWVQANKFVMQLSSGVFGVLSLILLLCLSSAEAGATGPKIFLPQPSVDLGEVFEDHTLSHVFEVKNTGDAPLMIKDIDPDCACSVVDYDRSIPPGGSGKITFSIKPYSVIHQFTKKADIFSNDPANPKAVIQISGLAKPFIEIKPGHLIRFQGILEEIKPIQINLVSHLATPLEISGFQTDIPDKIDVSITPEIPGKTFIVKVSNKINQSANYKGKIELITNSKQRPRLILRVFADIYPASAVSQ